MKYLFLLFPLFMFSQGSMFGILSNQSKGLITGTPPTLRQVAFPTAYGYGMNTTGGRGGAVIHVTNLNNSGAGSLRQALEVDTGTRTVVFDVSGYIDITTPIKIRQGYGNITILGQTSPEGITLRGASLWIHESNVIVRHLKIKPGYDAYQNSGIPRGQEGYEPDDAFRIVAFNGYDIDNVIVDHCTFSWANDELIELSTGDTGTLDNVTVQNSIIAENVDKHYGVLVYKAANNITFYRNFFAHNQDRNIAVNTFSGKKTEMVNNVVYGWQRGTWQTYANKMDIIGNIYKLSQATKLQQVVKLEAGDFSNAIGTTEFYITDNTLGGGAIDLGANVATYSVGSRLNTSTLSVLGNGSVVSSVLPTVGANLFYDTADTRVVNDYYAGTGNIPTDEATVGGYPTIGTATRAGSYDTDGDGMADSWEVSNFGNLTKTATGKDLNAFYDNLEMFSFSLVGEL